MNRIQTCMRVCQHFAPERRRAELTFEHHKEVMSLRDPQIEDQVLALAVLNNWSSDTTRLTVREYQHASAVPPGEEEHTSRSSVIVRVKCPSCEGEFDWEVGK